MRRQRKTRKEVEEREKKHDQSSLSRCSPPQSPRFFPSSSSRPDENPDSPADKITLPLFKSVTASSAESHNFPLLLSSFFIGGSPMFSAGLGTEPSLCFETS